MSFNGFDFGNLAPDDYKYWAIGDKKFMAVKLKGYMKSAVGASGSLRWFHGVTGSASKDNEVAMDWIIFVKKGDEISTLDSMEFKEATDHLAKITGAPVNTIFREGLPQGFDTEQDTTKGSL